MATAAGRRRRDSTLSMDYEDPADGLHGPGAVALSQSFASGSLTELSSLYSMSEDVRIIILTYNDRTVTHLHIKWGVAVGPPSSELVLDICPLPGYTPPVTNPR